MTCKDCYHCNMCLPRVAVGGDKICSSFKDKSRIIEPTLNVGEKVWFLDRNSNEIYEATVIRVEYNYFTNPQEWIEVEYISSSIGRLTYKTRIDLMLGKVVFFTKKEAEAKLKELTMGDMGEAFELYKVMHKKRVAKTPSRIEFAENLLKQNGIEYKICNASTGQINVYIGNKCLTFYAGTGKIQGYTNARGIEAFVSICRRKIKELNNGTT